MGVPKMRALSPRGVKIKRIGQKAIHCGRVFTALEARLPKAAVTTKKKRTRPKLSFRIPNLSRMQLAFIGAACVVLLVSGTGYYFYDQEQDKARAIAEEKQLERDQEAEKIASECRRQKAVEKADQIGLLTYDQLYDYDECDKLGQSQVGQ